MRRRKTDVEFKQEVYDLVGNEYIFLDDYQGVLTKIRVKHNKCGRTYGVTPGNFLIGERCPYCSAKFNFKKSDAEFKREIFDLAGNEYILLDSYVNSYTKLKIKHNECGHIYKVNPNSFLHGSRCPYCNGNAKKTNFQFKKEVFDLVGNEYTFLNSYTNSKTKLRVKHNRCGHIYEVQPNAFLNGKRCPYCCNNANKTNDQFKQEIKNLVGDEYTFLDTYVNNHTKLRVKHNKCGHIYEVQPKDFLHGNRCPYCNSPKGELIIARILDRLSISYESQKTFDDFKDTQPLSYDFYIPDQNILIEYQGIQHYEPVDYFGGEDRFIIQQKHDKMKAEYAKEHSYNLIAVPYTYDTFSKIKKYLIKYGLSK